MAIDLTHARSRVEQLLMTDTVTFTDVPLGSSAGALNDTTGVYTPPTGALVYSGICQVVAGAQGSNAYPDIGVENSLNVFTIYLPWSLGNAVDKGHYATINSCQDSTLVGHTFKVRHVVRTSLAVRREVIVERLETNRGQ